MSKLLDAFLQGEETTIEDLKNSIQLIQSEIKKRETKKLNEAKIKLREYASELGVSLEALLEAPSNVKERKQVAPVYRNKNNSAETWTGRGRQPLWLVAELEKGAKLEDFAI